MPETGLTDAQAHKAREFLDALQMSTVSDACAAAKIGRRTVYEWRDKDAQFRADWEAITEATTDLIEKKTVELALNGDDDGRQYPQLLQFLLERRRRDPYQKGVDVNHSGTVKQGPHIPTGDELGEWFDRFAEIRNGEASEAR